MKPGLNLIFSPYTNKFRILWLNQVCFALEYDCHDDIVKDYDSQCHREIIIQTFHAESMKLCMSKK